ncbi:hypothetical protein [Streptomyces sp. NPDC096012]|uniref:DUF6924 domain-containing protein n=1 Tax=Streptomyces sp. NPDC096012 TaxID=3155684 RepID=UPI00336A4BC1
MRPVINRARHDFETEALVICTDYSDDEAWRAVVALLDQSDGGFEVRHHLWTTVPRREFAYHAVRAEDLQDRPHQLLAQAHRRRLVKASGSAGGPYWTQDFGAKF